MLPALNVPLARVVLDRDGEARSRPGLLDDLRAERATRVLAVHDGRVLVDGTEAGDATLRLVGLAALTSAGLPADAPLVYLGRTLGVPAPSPVVAVAVTDEIAATLDAAAEHWVGLRAAAPILADAEVGLLAQAVAITNWRAMTRHCPRCGAVLDAQQGGWVLVCPVDGTQVFPRTDPAVIVLVTDADDRVLLGSNAMWQNNRYSLLAGFVEPGESLEHAVIRELKEETGLDVADPIYRGSQPWPFPASIMLGFRASLASHESVDAIRPDGMEILSLRWFTRDQIRSAADGVVLPGASSIARALLEEWLGEPIVDGDVRW
ncbi:NAD(+) diphosphatase [Glaciibacter flavus]|uniref:NAD(+) diphosphatase n=1 Tax=Orlajensenia flava TaxID=2565934 RepID=A0A4S4G0X9_9MICO|nr:NAD(+) diphosphatase [Glaciibacter flavus]THG36311.1 NAD(+) diphosphatase [Glaciibacter flavus]